MVTTLLLSKKTCPVCRQKTRPIKINNVLKVCPKCHYRIN